jgi:hypothetical protein
MIDPADIPPIEDDELPPRCVTQRSQFRKADLSLKPDLFIPPPSGDLSVTRHRDATDEEIWGIGRDVATTTNRTLYGRGDLRAVACRVGPLRIGASPLPENPNHADISGWPPEKEDRKALAIELAAAAGKMISAPPER